MKKRILIVIGILVGVIIVPYLVGFILNEDYSQCKYPVLLQWFFGLGLILVSAGSLLVIVLIVARTVSYIIDGD